MCGVMRTRGCCHNAWLGGSGSVCVTSSMAPASCPESSAAKDSPLVRALLGFCQEMNERQRDALESETLADLVSAATEREPMYFI